MEQFDGDLFQVAAAVLDRPVADGVVGCVDPIFFAALQINSMGHKMLFAKGIVRLGARGE